MRGSSPPSIRSPFAECFVGLVSSRCPVLAGELIAIDGKTLRRSGTKGGKKALHVISARAGSRGITLGQLAVAEKSNEITAVPKLLAQLDVKCCVVSLDAMGCQHRTAVAIAHAGRIGCCAGWATTSCKQAANLRGNRIVQSASPPDSIRHASQSSSE
ncbi:ISAs1 family transposase [Akkermansiaceae bacterium]|nr:ISAs1 family transposase [Akkermansiaceae bacterium]